MSRRSAYSVGLAAMLSACLAHPLFSLALSPHGGDSRLETQNASVLVDYFETFLRDKDIDAFQRGVMACCSQETLARVARSGSVQSRRASLFALGLMGSIRVNEVVARGMRDSDPVVRSLAQNALWAIWFRADSPENNAVLKEVRDLIGRERPREAVELATRLIARSPGFAEAYNQRAIALFSEERFDDCVLDCIRVLDRNPYHIWALVGLGQCYLRLDRRSDALATFRRALKLQPFSASLRETVEALEANIE